MSKVKIVYWTGTGNTLKMAEAIAEGVKSAGGEAEVVTFDDVTPDALAAEDVVALGCPAMGAENLEESVVEPFVTEYEGKCSGKKLGLFGSYGWGDGQWMRDWVDRMSAAGANIVTGEGLLANNEPDADAIAEAQNFGKALANA
ncbi:MAG: flavodoxin [Butyrivibrio sp.]|jgi:flavodoxin short chain|nr:flavodoxin [Butyrivibrio sp.]MCR4832521.1 flavodoxin [Butyrivibrio sp.]